MKWFRVYSEILEDRKVQSLPPDLFKVWINILALAAKQECRGVLPLLPDISFALRCSDAQTSEFLGHLQVVGLIDEIDGQLMPHNWMERQPNSDDAAARMRSKRSQDSSGTCTEQTQNMYPPEREKIRTEENREERERECAQQTEHRPSKRPFESPDDERFQSPYFLEMCSAMFTTPDAVKRNFRTAGLVAGAAVDAELQGYSLDHIRIAGETWTLPNPPNANQIVLRLEAAKNGKLTPKEKKGGINDQLKQYTASQRANGPTS